MPGTITVRAKYIDHLIAVIWVERAYDFFFLKKMSAIRFFHFFLFFHFTGRFDLFALFFLRTLVSLRLIEPIKCAHHRTHKTNKCKIHAASDILICKLVNLGRMEFTHTHTQLRVCVWDFMDFYLICKTCVTSLLSNRLYLSFDWRAFFLSLIDQFKCN